MAPSSKKLSKKEAKRATIKWFRIIGAVAAILVPIYSYNAAIYAVASLLFGLVMYWVFATSDKRMEWMAKTDTLFPYEVGQGFIVGAILSLIIGAI